MNQVNRMLDQIKKSLNRREYEVLILPLMEEVKKEQALIVDNQIESKLKLYLNELERLAELNSEEISGDDEKIIYLNKLRNIFVEARGVL